MKDNDASPPDDRSADTYFVRIAGRTHEIRSAALYDMLGTEVRYRLHLSAHARQLVAIESVDRDRGPSRYRAAPRGG